MYSPTGVQAEAVYSVPWLIFSIDELIKNGTIDLIGIVPSKQEKKIFLKKS